MMESLHAALIRAGDGSRRAVLDKFHQAFQALAAVEASPDASERLRGKARAFLDLVDAAERQLGARFVQPTYLINVAGEAMVRSDFIHGPLVEALQVGLYFFGLEQVERRWPNRAAVYLAIHAEHLSAFVSRASLKELVAAGAARLAEGRPFCITYSYLNSLRKAYWERCRASEDAMDRAITGSESLAGAEPEAAAPPESSPADKVALMLDIFRNRLSDEQRWIYLAKNRAALHAEPGEPAGPGLSVEAMLSELARGSPVADELSWADVARRLGMNEKSAKREYLRTLHTILQESCRAVFGDGPVPSRFVRRILEQIRTVVYEKDLRLRSQTGRGLGPLFEKWEVALRFVLNHEKVTSG